MEINLAKNLSNSLDPKVKTPRDALIEVIMLLIIGGLFTYFMVLPKLSVQTQKRAELNELLKEEEKTAEQLKTLNKLVKDLKSNDSEISKLDEALPLDGGTINLNLLIDSLAKSSGVAISDISISGKTGVVAGDKELLKNIYQPARSLQKLSGSVNVQGSYDQLKKFLNKLETSARLIDVQSVSIDSAASGGLSMQLVINSYYLAPPSKNE